MSEFNQVIELSMWEEKLLVFFLSFLNVVNLCEQHISLNSSYGLHFETKLKLLNLRQKGNIII